MGKPEKKKAKRIKEESEEDDDDDFKGTEDDDDDDDDEDDERDHGKKDDKDVVKKNAQGEAYFELAKTRRVTVRSFKGAKLIDIREFYDKNGSMEPGKKGISLSLDQYKALKEIVKTGHIDDAISAMK